MNREEYLLLVESIAGRFLHEYSRSIAAEFKLKLASNLVPQGLPRAIYFTGYPAHSPDKEPNTLNIYTLQAHVYDCHAEKEKVFDVDEWHIDKLGAAVFSELLATISEEHRQNHEAVSRLLRDYVAYQRSRIIAAPPETRSRANRAVESLQRLARALSDLGAALDCKQNSGNDDGDYTDCFRAAATMYLRFAPQINACTTGAPLLGPLYAEDTRESQASPVEVTEENFQSLDYTHDVFFSYSVRLPESAAMIGTALAPGLCTYIAALIKALQDDPNRIDIPALYAPAGGALLQESTKPKLTTTLTWSELSFQQIGKLKPEVWQILAHKKTRANAITLGMTTPKGKVVLGQWNLFKRIIEGNGFLNFDKSDAPTMTALRQSLIKTFAILDDPIPHDKNAGGYKAGFQILKPVQERPEHTRTNKPYDDNLEAKDPWSMASLED